MLGKEFNFHGSDVDLRGVHIAEVVDTADPKALERVRVRVIGVHDPDNKVVENSIWAMHVAPSRSSSGEVPEVGDYIYVMFPNPSDPMYCLWIGYCRVKG